jgi:hypothetical protein
MSVVGRTSILGLFSVAPASGPSERRDYKSILGVVCKKRDSLIELWLDNRNNQSQVVDGIDIRLRDVS